MNNLEFSFFASRKNSSKLDSTFYLVSVVILTERSGGRISRRDYSRYFARYFTTFNMTNLVLDNYYIIP